MTKYVVVTGASTGIGRGAVKVLTDKGFHVFGSVRKESDAASLRQEFGDHVTALIFDVTDEAAVKAGAAQVKDAIGDATLSGLVNNAGIAVSGPLMHLPVEELRHQLEVNTVSPIIVAQAFLPMLGATNPPAKTPGRIVNISSVAGKMASPFIGPYAASKHALEALTDSMRRELMLYGIDVIAIGPGAVKTPIWDKAEEIDFSVYDKTDYANAIGKVMDYMLSQGSKGFPAEHLGEVIHKALTDPSPKARYAVVPDKFQNWTLPRLLPKRVVDKMIGKRLGLTRLGD